MDGVLVVDKPQGLTSHDVVAAARRALGEQRIGHTGTLDPLATGVLPLACGRATRLVRFLTASDKDYDATIRFGLTTDTYDITGSETEPHRIAPPAAPTVDAALASLTRRRTCRRRRRIPPRRSAGHARLRAGAAGTQPVDADAVPVTRQPRRADWRSTARRA